MSNEEPSGARDKKRAGSPMEAYFRNITVLNQALGESDEPFQDSHAAPQTGAVAARERAVLWLGCNVLRTPHLAQLAVKVLRLVNPELSVLGGAEHCCGSPMQEKGDRERALSKTIGDFQAERVPTLVSWCPSCHTNLRKGSDPASWGFEELHITEFIARHLERLELRPRLSARLMLHGHTGAPDRDRDMAYCRRLLNAIPGVAIVAEQADADLGLHCVPMLVAPRIGVDAFEHKLKALLTRAREAGAEMIVTIYHSCYRELEKRLSLDGLVIENYITLFAKALDLPVPANVYRELAHGGSARFDQLLSDAEKRGIDRAELERAVKAEFPPAPRSS
jgi:Fe-S oxidoreductase